MTPTTRPVTGRAAYRACLAGERPAEALEPSMRERLVAELHHRGWSDSEIAAHTRLQTYTVGRICDRLQLKPNSSNKDRK